MQCYQFQPAAFSSQLSAFSFQLSAFSSQRLSLDGILEDCSGYEEDEAGNGSNYSDEMKRRPAIAKLFPVLRKRCNRPGIDLFDDWNFDNGGYQERGEKQGEAGERKKECGRMFDYRDDENGNDREQGKRHENGHDLRHVAVEMAHDDQELSGLKHGDGSGQGYPWAAEHSSDQSRENDADELPYF